MLSIFVPSRRFGLFLPEAMQIPFSKYQGTGNDFVLIDNRDQRFPNENLTVIRQICHRKYGVGSDGLILIESDTESDFYMNFFNPDGSQSYCGNGSRCAVHFAQSLGMIDDRSTFRAVDGIHNGVTDGNMVTTSILPVSAIDRRGENFLINTGSPHYILFCEDANAVDLIDEARKIRFNDEFKSAGVNVNFVEIISPGQLRMRTYERGVENETLSCGTGVTAAALAHLASAGGGLSAVKVETRGGHLEVEAKKQDNTAFSEIELSGPVQKTFTGNYILNL